MKSSLSDDSDNSNNLLHHQFYPDLRQMRNVAGVIDIDAGALHNSKYPKLKLIRARIFLSPSVQKKTSQTCN